MGLDAQFFCFTTCLIKNEAIEHSDYHFERLSNGLKYKNSDPKLLSLLQLKWSQLKIPLDSPAIRIELWLKQSDLDLRVISREHSNTLTHVDSIFTQDLYPSCLKSPVLLGREADKLFYDEGGVLELGAANIFFVLQESVITPKLRDGILDGITRKLVIKELKKSGIEVEQRSVKLEEISDFDFAFGTNSLKGAYLLKSIDKIEFKEFLVWNRIKTLLKHLGETNVENDNG